MNLGGQENLASKVICCKSTRLFVLSIIIINQEKHYNGRTESVNDPVLSLGSCSCLCPRLKVNKHKEHGAHCSPFKPDSLNVVAPPSTA